MHGLGVLFGSIVGIALGLTGGGGSVIAVPLLVYGLGVEPHEAVAVSLAAVGATALIGAVQRLARRQVEVLPGLVFAAAGMLGAPGGAALARRIPSTVLLALFAGLVVLTAIKLWRGAPAAGEILCRPDDACQRDERGQLRFSTRCAALLIGVGVLTGVLSGLFGVGGGFVIVPALTLFSRMPIHRAVATSLLVISLVSVSGVVSHLLGGSQISWALSGSFVLGGAAGLWAGSRLAERLSGPRLQRGFAVALLAVALFVLAKSAFELT